MMASTSDIVESLSQSVSCPVCFMVFYKPRSLPCGHTFCLDCVQQVCAQISDESLYIFIPSDDDDDEFISDYINLDRAIDVPCPVCRKPFRSPVGTLPVNFVIQDVIDETLQSVKGICQACFRDRRIQLTTVRCHDRQEDLCDSCTQYCYYGHRHTSLLEKRCDKHQQKLELYCITCQTNICVLCFSEVHQSHECDAVDKLADKLIDMLTNDLDQLMLSKAVLQAALREVRGKTVTIKKHLSVHVADAKIREAEGNLQVEKSGENMERFMKTKLKAIKLIVERSDSGEVIDQRQATDLQRDVNVLLSVIIGKLNNNEERLQEVLDNIAGLETRANGIVNNRSTSSSDVTDNRDTIYHIHDDIKSIAEEFQHLTSSGNGVVPIPTLSSKGQEDLRELLKHMEALNDVLLYDELPVPPPPSPSSSSSSAAAAAVSSGRSVLSRFLRKIRGRRHHGNHHQHQQHADKENDYVQLTSNQERLRRCPPAVLPKPRLTNVNNHHGNNEELSASATARSDQLMTELTQKLSQREARTQADENNLDQVNSSHTENVPVYENTNVENDNVDLNPPVRHTEYDVDI